MAKHGSEANKSKRFELINYAWNGFGPNELSEEFYNYIESFTAEALNARLYDRLEIARRMWSVK